MNEARKLTEYQVEIIRRIIGGDVRAISFNKPHKQLGDVVKGRSQDETLEALRSLENDFDVLALEPRKRLFVDVSEYMVKQGRARELYDSYVVKEE